MMCIPSTIIVIIHIIVVVINILIPSMQLAAAATTTTVVEHFPFVDTVHDGAIIRVAPYHVALCFRF